MIDATRAKRGVIVLALVVLAIGAITIFALPSFWPVTIANGLMAVVGDVFGPAVAALTLGLYARNQLARRMGRNAAFDHAGNVAIAVVAGAVGYACRRSNQNQPGMVELKPATFLFKMIGDILARSDFPFLA